MRARTIAASLVGAAAFLLAPVMAGAQTTPLSSQIDAVYAAQQREAAAMAAARKQLADKQAGDQARSAAATRRAQAGAAARTRRHESAERAEHKRDREFVDQQRSIVLQHEHLQLAQERARVARVNEFINRDLAHQDAETDVIKSNAEATRNLSVGEKTYLDDAGAAEIRRTASPVD